MYHDQLAYQQQQQQHQQQQAQVAQQQQMLPQQQVAQQQMLGQPPALGGGCSNSFGVQSAASNNVFRNSSFPQASNAASGFGNSGIGLGGNRGGMPGLAQPPANVGGSGLNLSGGGSSLGSALGGAGRLGGGGGSGGFGTMQGGGGGGQANYNPSSEILSMINKGQGLGLGLPPNQSLSQSMGMPPSLPQALVQPGMPPGSSSMSSLGIPQVGDISSSQAPGFDLSDFPSLGQRSTSGAPASSLQQFRAQGGGPGLGHGLGQNLSSSIGIGGLGVPQQPNPEFAIQSEDFPSLPGAKPAPSSDAAGTGSSQSGGALGGGGGLFRGGDGDSMLGMGGKDGALDGGLGGLGGLAGRGGASGAGSTASAERSPTDQYGLMGLLSVIRMTDPDLNTLALGTDLTTLGLNLNSSEPLYSTFASPWADAPALRDPAFSLPQCYYMQPPALKTGHFSKFQLETLFYIFYNMPRDTLQAYAATELYNRDWRYHKDLKLWFTRASRQGADGAAGGAKSAYIYFDIQEWKKKMFHGAGGGGGDADAPDISDQQVEGLG